MADAGNPGTPPAAGAPAAQGGNQPVGGNQPGQPGGKRLIAGKYETLEDAVEQGIFGMEKAFHQTREDLAKVTRVLEHAVGMNNNPGAGTVPVGSGGRGNYAYPDPYGRGAPPQNDPDYIDPTQFIVNPRQILDQRDQKMLNRVAGVVQDVVANAMIVSEFKRMNPDLVPHERVVRAFMNETDPTKDYASRLADAASMTKEYLARLRGGNNPPPAGNSYVENPRSTGGPGATPPQVGAGAIPETESEEEKELMDYIRERQTDMAARLGMKT
jgi:hypothetical protein